MDMRCRHKMYGTLTDNGLLEVKCKSAFCGHKPGVVVLHRFDVKTGKLVETKRYKDTPKVNNSKRDRRVA